MLLSLGLFVFKIQDVGFQSLQRSTSQRIASNDRMGQRPAKQYVGQGDDIIKLSGTLYPEIMGGRNDMNLLRAMADTGKAHTLVSGTGEVFGTWMIESIEQTEEALHTNGAPRKISFNISLTRTDENQVDNLASLGNFVDALITDSVGITPIPGAYVV